MKSIDKTLGLAALVLMVSCRVGPDYQTPAVATPTTFAESAPDAAGQPEEPRWWRAFHDPLLDTLIERALRSNHELRVATARLREVRARYGVTEAALYPSVDAQHSVQRDEVAGNGRAADAARRLGQDGRTSFFSGFDASWELDVFGGNARAVEAAAADVDATAAQRQAVVVTLLGEVGRAYVELRGAQRQLAVYEASARTAAGTADLTWRRRQAGLATELDVARARAQRADIEAEIPRLAATVRQAMHRLEFLTGVAPGALAGELAVVAPIPVPPATVLTGLPAELLHRRPDVRRSERQLAAATARIGVATAELYPRFSISALFGLEALGTAELLRGQSRVATLGAGSSWNLFAAGRTRARIAAEGAAAEGALAEYERSYLAALAEVEDALVAYRRELERRQLLADAAAESRRAARLARELFEGDLATFLDALDAERVSYQAESRLAQSDTAIATHLVQVYKALGGGWEVAEPPVVAAVGPKGP